MSKYVDTEKFSEFEMLLQTRRAVLRNTLECVTAEIKCANERISLLGKIIDDAKAITPRIISTSIANTLGDETNDCE